jgi:phosphatidylserine/phosphatidylglycerophosphate/cardiolipin synthase-like enzyme
VVDGEWATIGSANLVDLSMLADHTELNVSIWDADVARRLVCQLVEEHTGEAVSDDVAALAVAARSARASRASLMRGGPVLAGCYALDAARYGQDPPLTVKLPRGA